MIELSKTDPAISSLALRVRKRFSWVRNSFLVGKTFLFLSVCFGLLSALFWSVTPDSATSGITLINHALTVGPHLSGHFVKHTFPDHHSVFFTIVVALALLGLLVLMMLVALSAGSSTGLLLAVFPIVLISAVVIGAANPSKAKQKTGMPAAMIKIYPLYEATSLAFKDDRKHPLSSVQMTDFKQDIQWLTREPEKAWNIKAFRPRIIENKDLYLARLEYSTKMPYTPLVSSYIVKKQHQLKQGRDLLFSLDLMAGVFLLISVSGFGAALYGSKDLQKLKKISGRVFESF